MITTKPVFNNSYERILVMVRGGTSSAHLCCTPTIDVTTRDENAG